MTGMAAQAGRVVAVVASSTCAAVNRVKNAADRGMAIRAASMDLLRVGRMGTTRTELRRLRVARMTDPRFG